MLCEIVLRKFSRQIEKVGQILQIDKYSVMGIILSFGTSIAMLPLFSKMNQKGKILNAAFSLSGAFVFGGQLGFIAGVNPNSITWFVVVKLVAGIAGLLIANLFEKMNSIMKTATLLVSCLICFIFNFFKYRNVIN